MSPDLTNILDDCLTRMRQGYTLVECLALYPEYAGELKPLLETAAAIYQVPPLLPSPQAMAAGRARLLQRAAQLRLLRAAPGPIARLGQFLSSLSLETLFPRRLVPAAAAIMACLLLVVFGVMPAAADSLPDSPLYPVKRVIEETQVALTFDPDEQARLQVALAARRTDEIETQVNQGRPLPVSVLELVADQNQRALGAITRLPESEATTLLRHFVAISSRQEMALEQVLIVSPAQPAVAQVLAATQANHQWAESVVNNPAILRRTATPVPPTATPVTVAVLPPATATPGLVVTPFTPSPTPRLDKSPVMTPTPALTPTAVTEVKPTSTLPSSPSATVTSPALSTPTSTSVPTSTPAVVRVRLEGPIQAIEGNRWQVSGQFVRLTANSDIGGLYVAQVGGWVELLAERWPDGSLVVIWARITRPAGGEPVEFQGVLLNFTSAVWVVSDQTVNLNAETQINGTPALGYRVTVKALRRIDGTLIAQRLDIQGPDQEMVEFRGKVLNWGPAGGRVGGVEVIINVNSLIPVTPAIGNEVSVRGLRLGDGRVLAARILILPPPDVGQEQDIKGVIRVMESTYWVISGITITVNSNTLIDETQDVARVGATATARVRRQSDGSLLALRIKIGPISTGNPGGPLATPIPDKSASPTATPTPFSSPTATPRPATPSPSLTVTATPVMPTQTPTVTARPAAPTQSPVAAPATTTPVVGRQ